MQQHPHSGPGPVCSIDGDFMHFARFFPSRRLLTVPLRRLRSCNRGASFRVHAFQNDVKPAYNKYRSRSDVEKDYIKQWKITTARDGSTKPRTFWSTIFSVPMWIKYEAMPEIVKYAWYIVWTALKAVHYKFHKWAVLQGAKLDLALAKRGGVPMQTFSRRLVLERFHNKVGVRENLSMRYGLLKGQDLPHKSADQNGSQQFHMA